MIKIDDEWKEADYLKSLTGWTDKELIALERIRELATATP
jgi:hypothetical protein